MFYQIKTCIESANDVIVLKHNNIAFKLNGGQFYVNEVALYSSLGSHQLHKIDKDKFNELVMIAILIEGTKEGII